MLTRFSAPRPHSIVSAVLAAASGATAATPPVTAGEFAFAHPLTISTPGGAVDIVAADFDDDDDLDIASLEVTQGGITIGMVNIMRNDRGSLTLVQTIQVGTAFIFEFNFNELEAADLDGDGDVDLACLGTQTPLTLRIGRLAGWAARERGPRRVRRWLRGGG